MWSRMDVMYFTRHVCSWACHVSIADWFVPFILYWVGVCWHVAYWHVAYFDRTVHVYQTLIGRPPICKIWKKVTNWAGICWHVACPATNMTCKTHNIHSWPHNQNLQKSWTKFHVLRSNILQQIKAKPADFRPMFHAEPAGIRSWSSEPAVIRSRRLELKS